MLKRINKIKKYNGLSLRIILKAYWRFFWVDLAIRFLPFQYWKKLLHANIKPIKTDNKPQLAVIISLSEKVARHHFCKINCLRRCVVQKRLIAEYGYECNLIIGVMKQEGELKAHSWLEVNGICINDSTNNIEKYTVLPTNNQNPIWKNLQ